MHLSEGKNMADMKLGFFGVNPKSIKTKLDEFSDLELQTADSGKALELLLKEEGIKVPDWVQFFLRRGMISTRRGMIEEYNRLYGKDALVMQ